MFLKLYEENPNEKQIKQVVECLQDGGIIIYPTDTVYGIGCDLLQPKALDRLCSLTHKKREKSNFSFICSDLSHLSDFTRPLDNRVFKLMKQLLPGPYTFVLENDEKEPLEELYIVDDDLVIIDSDMMQDLDKDLDEFLDNLLKDA